MTHPIMVTFFSILFLAHISKAVSQQTPWEQLDNRIRSVLLERAPSQNPGAWYNSLSFDYRVSLACVLFKMLEHGALPLQLGKIKVDGVSRGGMIDFELKETDDIFYVFRGEKNLKKYLIDQGYVADFGAAYERRWGLRSPNVGTGLHWASATMGLINVHLDLYNPGKATGPLTFYDLTVEDAQRGYCHLKTDYMDNAWAKFHTPFNLIRGVSNGCGLGRDDHLRALIKNSEHNLPDCGGIL